MYLYTYVCMYICMYAEHAMNVFFTVLCSYAYILYCMQHLFFMLKYFYVPVYLYLCVCIMCVDNSMLKSFNLNYVCMYVCMYMNYWCIVIFVCMYCRDHCM